MAIEFINSASTVLTSSSSISITRPTNSTAGDLLVAHIFIEDNSDRITTTRVPAGWSTAVNQTVGARAVRQYVHWKVLTTSEPSSYTWSLDAADEVVGMISAYRGADVAAPIGNISASTDSGQSTAVVAPQITVQESGNWVVMCAGLAAGSTIAGSWVPPTSFTERKDIQTSTGAANISAVMADYSPASTGATGNKTYGAPVSDYFVASLVEIRLPIVYTLVVANSSNIPTCDAVALSQEYDVVVAGCVQVNVAEAPAIVQEHNLSVADAANIGTCEAVILTQDGPPASLTVSDSYNAVVSSDIGFIYGEDVKWTDGDVEFKDEDVVFVEHDEAAPTSLTVSGASDACVTETVGLEQEQNLTLSDAANVQTAESIALAQEQNLSVSDAYDAQTVGAVTLSQESDLALSDSVNVQTVESADLLQEHNLSVADSSDLTVSADVALTQTGEDAVAPVETVQVTASDTAALEQEHNLNISDCSNVTASQNVTLTQTGEDAVAPIDTVQVTASDTAELEQEHDLSLSDSANIQAAGTVALEQEHQLTVSDSADIQAAGAVALEQEHNLSVNNASDTPVTVEFKLDQEHELALNDSQVVNVAGSPALEVFGEIILVIGNSDVENHSDDVTLAVTSIPVVTRGGRRRFAYYQQPEVIEKEVPATYVLEVADAIQDHVVDDVALEQDFMLSLPVSVVRQIDTGNTISFTQRRRQRFIDEDAIILMAA